MPSTTSPTPESVRTRKEFGEALTALRERAGLSVRDVAKAAGLSLSTVGGYFSGKHVPPVKPSTVFPSILGALGVVDEADLARWEEALRRVRRAPGPRPAGAPPPYRGLAAFGVDDAEWFFGREREVGAVLALLTSQADRDPEVAGADEGPARPRMVAVVGASGSGKSSLLRAGVMAARRADGDDGRAMTPGRHPLEALRACLAEARAGLEAGAGGRGGVRLLVVDQFEELFTACTDPAEREAFVARLLALACAPEPVAVLIGLRADFYRQAASLPALVPVLQDAQLVLGPMDRDALRRTVTEPAARARLELEEGLADVVLADLPAEAGALPLLSHVLLTMWRSSGRSRLTVADYRATGGVRAAVTATAEHAYSGLTEAQRGATRRLFLRLVAIGDDTADTRRRVERGELLGFTADSDDLDAALQVFVEHRLLTVDSQGVEIAHEVLLDTWPRLRGWVDGDRAGLRLRRQITEAARTWAELGRDPSTLLRGVRLEAAAQWLRTRDADRELTAAEREFLDASAERQRAEHDREARQARRLRRTAATLAVLLVATLALAGWSAALTVTSSRDRDLALSRQVAAASDRVRSTDTSLAAQLAAVAYRRSPTAEARSALLDTSATATAHRLPGPRGVLQAVSVGADGHLVVGGSESGTVRLWRTSPDPSAGQAPAVVDVDHPGGGTVFATALAPDAKLLAAGGAGGVRLWDLTDPARPSLLPPLPRAPSGTVFAVAFAAGGRILAAAGVDGVRLWDVADPARAELLSAPAVDGAELHALAFDADARTLAVGAADGRIRLWRLGDPRRPEPLPQVPTGPTATVYALAFAAEGGRLAAGSADKNAYLWDAPAPGLPWPSATRLPGPTGWVNGVAFSPDGTRVAAGTSDSHAWQWDVVSRRVVASYPHPGPVTSVTYVGAGALATSAADGAARLWPSTPPHVGVAGTHYSMAFSADGRLLAAGAGANEAGLVDVRDPARPRLTAPPLIGPGGAQRLAGASALTPDGDLLATGGKDGSVLLWDVRDPARPAAVGRPFDADGAVVEALAFSPDGHTLAACGDDSEVRLWDVADPARPTALGPPLAPGGLVFAVTFSPDGHRLAAGTSDHAVVQWDVTDPRSPRQLGPAQTSAESYVFGLAYSPDGRLLAASSADRSVWVLDVADPARTGVRARLTDATNYQYGVAFSPDGHTLAASSADGLVRLWRVPPTGADFELRATLSAAAGSDVMGIAFSPDGGTLVAGNATGLVFWRLDEQAVARGICTSTGQGLSPVEWRLYLPGRDYDPPCPSTPS